MLIIHTGEYTELLIMCNTQCLINYYFHFYYFQHRLSIAKMVIILRKLSRLLHSFHPEFVSISWYKAMPIQHVANVYATCISMRSNMKFVDIMAVGLATYRGCLCMNKAVCRGF